MMTTTTTVLSANRAALLLLLTAIIAYSTVSHLYVLVLAIPTFGSSGEALVDVPSETTTTTTRQGPWGESTRQDGRKDDAADQVSNSNTRVVPLSLPFERKKKTRTTTTTTHLEESSRRKEEEDADQVSDNSTTLSNSGAVRKVQTADHTSSVAAVAEADAEVDADKQPSLTQCLSLNSQEWLEQPRFGNLRNDAMRHPSYIRHQLLDVPNALLHLLQSSSHNNNSTFSSLLNQSLCHEQSRFLNEGLNVSSASSQHNIRLWGVRLMYLVIHYHQHRWALEEAKQRALQPSCQDEFQSKHNVGPFDYECPDAKFLVMPLGGFGLGVNVRIIANAGLLLGLATNRVVIFANHWRALNSTASDERRSTKYCPNIASPYCSWPLVSCPRGDMQCFFQPVTPCALSHHRLNDPHQTYWLTWPEVRGLTRSYQLPKGHEKDPIWIVRPSEMQLGGLSVSSTTRKAMRSRTAQRARAQIDQYLRNVFFAPLQREAQRSHSPEAATAFLSMLEQARDSLFQQDGDRQPYNYLAAMDRVRHALTMYVMRPNLEKQQVLSRIAQQRLDNGGADTRTAQTIGLPIRASDKCKSESTCLSFQQHLQMTQHFWYQHRRLLQAEDSNNKSLAILFTSESKSMVRMQQKFVSQRNMVLFDNNQTSSSSAAPQQHSYQFWTNDQDVTPDSGFIKTMDRQVTADAALLGAISTLQFQLLSNTFTVGNCCSNFHILLNDFFTEGCGAASSQSSSHHHFYCLNEFQPGAHDNPALQVCCGWQKDCKDNRTAALEVWEKEHKQQPEPKKRRRTTRRIKPQS